MVCLTELSAKALTDSASVDYSELMDSLANGVIILNRSGQVIFANDWICDHVEGWQENFQGKTLLEMFPNQVSSHLVEAISDACELQLGRILSFQFHHNLLPLIRVTPAGVIQDLNVTILLKPLMRSGLTLLQCQDMTNSVKREQHLKANEKILRTERKALEMIATGSTLDDVSNTLCTTLEALLIGARVALLMLDDNRHGLSVLSAPAFPDAFKVFVSAFEVAPNMGTCRQALLYKKLVVSENVTNDPSWITQDQAIETFSLQSCWAMPILSARNDAIGVLVIYPENYSVPDALQKSLIDRIARLGAIAFERHQHIERINYLAMHDSLTGLANRSLLSEHLHRNLHRAQREKQRFALLFIDLDKFKWINDNHGHDAGDDVLLIVAQRLIKKLRSTDICARIGGDEFVVMLESISNTEAAVMVAESLCELIKEPIKWGNAELNVSASIGISLFPEDGNSADALLNRADDAMYKAKDLGKDRCVRLQASE